MEQVEFVKAVIKNINELIEENKEDIGFMYMPMIRLAKNTILQTLKEDPEEIRKWLEIAKGKIDAILKEYKQGV